MLTKVIKNYKYLIVIIFLLLVSVAYLTLVILARQDTLLIDNDQWHFEGQFGVNGHYTHTDDSKIPSELKNNLILFGSWLGDEKNTGKLMSPVFEAPRFLSLYVAGNLDRSGGRLYLRNLERNEVFPLKVRFAPGPKWLNAQWLLPTSWYHSQVQLEAIDNDTDWGGWIAVSAPYAANGPSIILDQVHFYFQIAALYLFHFLLFIWFGLCFAIYLWNKKVIQTPLFIATAILFSCGMGYFTFWVYFGANYLGYQSFGKYFSIAAMLLISIANVRMIKNTHFTTESRTDIILPLTLMFWVGLFYLSLLYWFYEGDFFIADILSRYRFTHDLPIDNVLPKIFADYLYNGMVPKVLIGDWLTSDRPPLQTGSILFQYVLMKPDEVSVHYQVLSTILQCCWVPAIWALSRILGLNNHCIGLIFLFAIFSGFFLLHSVFTWPKLLAGSLTILTIALLIQQGHSFTRIGLAGASYALGLLSHGGVIFSVFALAFIAFIPRFYPGIKSLLIGSLVFIILIIPWLAYQKLHAPPGNRLVKWHFAGVTQIDNRTTVDTLVDAYQSLSIWEIINIRWANIQNMIGKNSLTLKTALQIRIKEFFHIINALVILNIGWIFFVHFWLQRHLYRNVDFQIMTLSGFTLISLVIWWLLTFLPGSTNIHQGSYATMISLFLILSILIANLPKIIGYLLAYTQVLYFIIVWVLATVSIDDAYLLNVPAITATGLIFLLLQYHIKMIDAASEKNF